MKSINRRSTAFALSAIPLLHFARIAAADTEAVAMAKKLMEAAPAHGERTPGDPKAPVTMIEYASATCPHCAEFHNDIWPGIKKDYVETGKVFFILREFPTDQTALGAFMLARCVAEDKYFAVIDLMFRRQAVWTKGRPKDELYKIVGMAGLSAADADACLNRKELFDAIMATRKMATEDFGVKGTPTFFVNGTYLDGHEDPQAVRKSLDDALAKAGAN